MNKTFFILLALVPFYVSSEDLSGACKAKILSSVPYGKGAIITSPSEIIDQNNVIIFDWDDLTITAKDGSRPLAIGRCVYSKETDKVIFLSIYTDNIITPHEAEIISLQSASSGKAKEIAKGLGLSINEIEWIKRNGRRSFYGGYNPDGEIIGFVKHSKEDLIHLDRLQIINLYQDKYHENQYLSVQTKLSEALSDKL